jgi:hypothetical protein
MHSPCHTEQHGASYCVNINARAKLRFAGDFRTPTHDENWQHAPGAVMKSCVADFIASGQ